MTDNDTVINKSYQMIKVGDYYFIPIDPDLAIKNAANESFTEEITEEGILLRRQRKDNSI